MLFISALGCGLVCQRESSYLRTRALHAFVQVSTTHSSSLSLCIHQHSFLYISSTSDILTSNMANTSFVHETCILISAIKKRIRTCNATLKHIRILSALAASQMVTPFNTLRVMLFVPSQNYKNFTLLGSAIIFP